MLDWPLTKKLATDQVFINEETRYDIYERSVEDMERFESILDRFSLKDRHEKSVRLFLKALENKEKSSQGQRAFREELILHPIILLLEIPTRKELLWLLLLLLPPIKVLLIKSVSIILAA